LLLSPTHIHAGYYATDATLFDVTIIDASQYLQLLDTARGFRHAAAMPRQITP